MATLKVSDLGDYIREQRRSAQISLRQLANLAGVSNPYLSQIERGLRKPSAEILQQIAKALRVSAETLYVRAGILEDIPVDRTVIQAVLGDSRLSERQKSVLLQIYESFCSENAESRRPPEPETPASAAAQTAPLEDAASPAGGEGEQPVAPRDGDGSVEPEPALPSASPPRRRGTGARSVASGGGRDSAKAGAATATTARRRSSKASQTSE